MRVFLVILLLWSNLPICLAQDTTLVLNTGMFGTDQQINLTTATGWVYHAGHNPTWAKSELNTTGWARRNPSTLSIKDTDSTGRVEGWFRLRIRLDSTFRGMPLWFRKSTWSAADLYVDGQLLASYGSTGRMGEPYKAYYYLDRWSTPVRLTPGRNHLIAFHVVDYKVPFSLTKIKSELGVPISQGLRLTGPKNNAFIVNAVPFVHFFYTLQFVATLLITLLLWLLVWKNVGDVSVIRLLAVQSSLTALYFSSSVICFLAPSRVTFENTRPTIILLFLTVAFLPIILLRMVKHPFARRSTAPLLLAPIVAYSIDTVIGPIYLSLSVFILLILVLLYVLISSWTKLGGASRAIVGGIIAAFVIALFSVLMPVPPGFLQSIFILIIGTAYSLAIPVSFLVYVTLRFIELFAEVRERAAAVVQVTEEKRQLLADQNQLLEQQVEQRTAQLKASQNQLIQKEKLASLGELTAGIAHEIQNPLNFVNNFSEVSVELMSELTEELDRGETDEAKAIAHDVYQNLQKIHHHGGRAASIVRGMLEHSRTETGEKRPTDLNALADEYFKIAYHGLRAKDKNFDAELVLDFDTDLGRLEVVPQEIGRVLLNLYNNAFYAVAERAKQSSDADYKPTVEVHTQRQAGHVVIRVRDNGTGISDAVKAKIFQPFFTTKPTGEGTGLGLSLSYDIISKGHGGTLTVESTVGEGTEFTIRLSTN